jgi:hypothetical protein
MTTGSSVGFTFTCCTFSLVPKLTLVNCSSLLTVQLAMVKSYTHSRISVSSTIISPTSWWKKVSCKCCLTMLGGIVNFIASTPTSLTSCFRTNYIVTICGIHYVVGIGLVWVGTAMVPIENMPNSMENITSSSSSNIPE